MIELLFACEACRKDFAPIVVRDGDVARVRTALYPTGQITITKTANKDQIDKRLEIVLG